MKSKRASGNELTNAVQHKTAPPIKAMTKSRIRNITEYYLSQRDASSHTIRTMLERRAFAWLSTLQEDVKASEKDIFNKHVDELIIELIDQRIINDHRFAVNKASSLRRSGKSERAVRLELSKKGLSSDVVSQALQAANEEVAACTYGAASDQNIDLLTADNLARKKKIGPYRGKFPSDIATQQKIWRREVSMLARAGYSLDVIKQVLKLRNVDDDL